jgi:hypothetical protein
MLMRSKLSMNLSLVLTLFHWVNLPRRHFIQELIQFSVLFLHTRIILVRVLPL